MREDNPGLKNIKGDNSSEIKVLVLLLTDNITYQDILFSTKIFAVF